MSQSDRQFLTRGLYIEFPENKLRARPAIILATQSKKDFVQVVSKTQEKKLMEDIPMVGELSDVFVDYLLR